MDPIRPGLRSRRRPSISPGDHRSRGARSRSAKRFSAAARRIRGAASGPSFTARASFDRKDFELAWNRLLETGGLIVGERIDVDIDVEAVKKTIVRVAARDVT